MTRREVLDTERMLERLAGVLYQASDGPDNSGSCRADAEQLRRISMTLHRWHELECGSEHGAIERDEATGKPYWRSASGHSRSSTPDREKGALARLAKVMARYPSLKSYVQTDPRGAALYILRPGDVPDGEDVSAYYSRGVAVHQ